MAEPEILEGMYGQKYVYVPEEDEVMTVPQHRAWLALSDDSKAAPCKPLEK